MPCGDGALTVTTMGGSGAALGHSGTTLIFTNSSKATCTVTGYPGAAGLDSAGKQVTQAQRSEMGYLGGVMSGSKDPVVTLAPGAKASALVEGTDNPQGASTSCPTLAALLVTPPGSHVSTKVSQAPGDCSGLAVHPVVPGTTGSYPSS